MNTWEIAILKSIESLGGKAELQQIYEKFPEPNGFRPLTEENKRITIWNEPEYQHQIRVRVWVLWHKKGELTQIVRGDYFLTKKGIERIETEKRKK